jgi:hypothetical protein
MNRQSDILLEKHSLLKIKKEYPNDMPAVKLITTFKDSLNLYFLTQMFDPKNEVWTYCRSFGFLED